MASRGSGGSSAMRCSAASRARRPSATIASKSSMSTRTLPGSEWATHGPRSSRVAPKGRAAASCSDRDRGITVRLLYLMAAAWMAGGWHAMA